MECDSWVNTISVRQTQMNVRCPRGLKSTQFHYCQVEDFAEKGDFLRWDGLQERHTIFKVMLCQKLALLLMHTISLSSVSSFFQATTLHTLITVKLAHSINLETKSTQIFQN